MLHSRRYLFLALLSYHLIDVGTAFNTHLYGLGLGLEGKEVTIGIGCRETVAFGIKLLDTNRPFTLQQ